MHRDETDSERQFDSDGAVFNGYDYSLGVWVKGGIVVTCPAPGECNCNSPRYATRAVKYLPGHEVHLARDLAVC